MQPFLSNTVRLVPCNSPASLTPSILESQLRAASRNFRFAKPGNTQEHRWTENSLRVRAALVEQSASTCLAQETGDCILKTLEVDIIDPVSEKLARNACAQGDQVLHAGSPSASGCHPHHGEASICVLGPPIPQHARSVRLDVLPLDVEAFCLVPLACLVPLDCLLRHSDRGQLSTRVCE